MSRDPAADQLINYKKSLKPGDKRNLVTANGALIDDRSNSLTVGPRGPILLQDFTLIDVLSHFNRERIPERVVHAKGASAFGYFDVTHDISKYCKAGLFSKVGKRTPLAVRMSTVAGESGSADTVRDPRGFAVKFYTEEGIWDLVGNNTPIFFMRDPLLFPMFIHSQKRNPVTHLKDADMFWDYLTLCPDSLHQVMFLFSHRGIPDGFRHMNGYGSHTLKTVNAKGEAFYVKFHYKTDQGIKNLTTTKAAELASTDPDYFLRDLYNAIAKGEYPSWTFYIQVMTFKQAETYHWNPFDVTKEWPNANFPLVPVGKIILDRNPKNYFAEVEQLAFSPAHMVPGIEASPDKMLQGRLFSYNDTHRYRLGTNFMQLPVNCPYQTRISNYQRDGPQTISNQKGAPNYYPNSFQGPDVVPSAAISKFSTVGDVTRYNNSDDDNYSQPALFWKNVLTPAERNRLVDNIVGHLKNASAFIQELGVKNFTKVDGEFGRKVNDGLKKHVNL